MMAKPKSGPKAQKLIKKVKKDIKSLKRTSGGVSGMIPPRVRGKGGYWSDFKNFAFGNKGGAPSLANRAISSLGGMGAEALGLPAEAGGRAGSWLSKALGMGKYTIKKNSLMKGGGGPVEGAEYISRPPTFGTTGVGNDIEICYEEFVMDVLSSTGFSKTSFINNAGNPKLFPWFWTIAGKYEEAVILGLIYSYKPTSSTYAGTTSSAMGSVIIATDDDPYDDPFQSKQTMLASEYSSDEVPYRPFMHPVECDPKRNVLKQYYVQAGATTASQVPGDERFSIPSITSIATVGQQSSGQIIGELKVSYHIRLTRPVLESAGTLSNFTQHANLSSNTGGTSPTIISNNVTGGVAFGVTFSGSSTAQSLVIDNSVNQLTGDYMIVVQSSINGGGFAQTNPILKTPVYTGLCSDPNTNQAPVAGTTTYRGGGDASAMTNFTGSCQAIQINFSGTGNIYIPMISNNVGALYFDVWITGINSSLTTRKRHTGVSNVDVAQAATDARIDVLNRELQIMKDLFSNLHGKEEVDPDKGPVRYEVDYQSGTIKQVKQFDKTKLSVITESDDTSHESSQSSSSSSSSSSVITETPYIDTSQFIVKVFNNVGDEGKDKYKHTRNLISGDQPVNCKAVGESLAELGVTGLSEIDDAYDICDVIIGRVNDSQNVKIHGLVKLAGISSECMQVPIIPGAYNIDTEDISVKMKYLFNQYLDVYDTFRQELNIFTDLADPRHVRNLKLVEQSYNDYKLLSSTLKKFNSV